MKKTFIFGLIAAALGFTACSSEDDLNVNDNNQKKGMVLRATVEQPAESRASISDDWHFAFSKYDEIKMTNSEIGYDNFYTFENDGEKFVSEDAKATNAEATWHAYFPSELVPFGSKTGLIYDVCDQYALAGSTTTTGKGGLAITMSPKVAILEINNQKGEIDINVKNSPTTWVIGLIANNAGSFDVLATTKKTSLLTLSKNSKPGTYYVVVPAGVQLAIKDGDKTIASTVEKGLKAGCYYNLTIAAPTTGKAYAVAPDCDVNWVQLWEGGPKFAEFNVGASSVTETGTMMTFTEATKAGTEYVWGANWCTPSKDDMEHLMTAAQGGTDNKVKCEYTQENSVWGFKFTGLTEGYTDNSVFFPAQYSDSDYGYALYWSATANGSEAWDMFLGYDCGDWFSNWDSSSSQDSNCLVRPVLK